jgi:hypothetical protein
MLTIFLAAAAATPSPPQRETSAPRIDDGAIYLGPAGVLLESDYFGVLQPRPGVTRIFPCRFHLRATASRTRLAQSCD